MYGEVPPAAATVQLTGVAVGTGNVMSGVIEIAVSGIRRKFATVKAVLFRTRCSSASQAGLLRFRSVHDVFVPAGTPSGEPM